VGQRDFLRYAVSEKLHGRGHLLKEYSIGIAVFRKKESFDPRLDSIVRTEARKLRVRLAKYFESEGKDDPFRIQLPLGKYTPIFSRALEAPATAALTPLSNVMFRDRPPLRIAVLPFANRSALRQDEFFSDGLTDELSHAFTRVRGLEVVARTSAFQFKGQLTDIREVGRRLNVQAVVEGSVRRTGNRVRILVQLDDAVNGHTVWSETYDRKLSNLFEVQREISTTITGEVGVHFRGGKALNTMPTIRNAGIAPRIYEDYLQGCSFWNRHTIEGFEAAISCFEKAVTKEPRYARAHASLAFCYVMVPILKAVLPSEFIPKVHAAASRALEAESSVGEAHIALALPLIHDYKWRAADEAFRRGLELCPSDAVGHAWYGTYLLSVGRAEEGLKEHRKVLELDPVAPPALNCLAQTLYYLRRNDEAAEQFRKALTLDPSFPRAHAGLGLTCLQNGSFVRGIAELELAQKLTPDLGRVKSDLAYAYAVSGHRDKAHEILNEFLGRFTPSFPALMIAEIYIGLGDKDRAFEWLNRAIDQKDLAVFLKFDPMYDPLRSDLRFAALLKRTNLT
jgi:TolB-like protein/Tfp pilus assembly protein PilF